jgi:hypothetical protein
VPFTTDQSVISVAAFGNSASHANASETHDDLSDESFSLHLLNAWHLVQTGELVHLISDSWLFSCELE